jgi:hypothetical protein
MEACTSGTSLYRMAFITVQDGIQEKIKMGFKKMGGYEHQ